MMPLPPTLNSAKRRSSPISRKLIAVTLLVATTAVFVTALSAIGFVRVVDTTAARNALQSQAERLANTSPATRTTLVRALSQVDGELIALIPENSAPIGSAADYIPRRIIAQVRAGAEVSTIVRVDSRTFLVEAVPSADGGGVLVAQDSESVRSLTPAVIGRIALALIVGLIVAVVAAFISARSVSRPLIGLSQRASRLAAGDRGLAAVSSGVTEIDHVDAALTTLDDALARSEARQREFLLSISHEIRTPLTALRGYAEALADGSVRPDELVAVGETLTAETARLTRFTDDLLALARLDAEDFTLDMVEGVSVALVAREVAEAWRARGAAEGVGIVAITHGDIPDVHTDPHRLRQVIDGLIENALRVSPADTHIRIGTRAAQDLVIIEVSDEGPGITEQDAAEAFDRARLRDRYRDTRPVGSGLGLSIASRLVTRLGGRITASPGEPGAVFRIELPTTPQSGD